MFCNELGAWRWRRRKGLSQHESWRQLFRGESIRGRLWQMSKVWGGGAESLETNKNKGIEG